MMILLWGCSPTPTPAPPPYAGPIVDIRTTLGDFEITLYDRDAPETVENFLAYVDAGFYDGSDEDGATLMHRVVPEFIVQGGGIREDSTEKPTRDAIRNEARDSGLSNLRGTVAMARTNAPNTATSQWFVNLENNDFLDPGESTAAGYAVFGSVTAGMGVVDTMSAVPAQAEFPDVLIVIDELTLR